MKYYKEEISFDGLMKRIERLKKGVKSMEAKYNRKYKITTRIEVESDVKEEATNKVMDFLKKNGIDKIDVIDAK